MSQYDDITFWQEENERSEMKKVYRRLPLHKLTLNLCMNEIKLMITIENSFVEPEVD
jgi:hypothetical protein